jgi:hypothetical protein
MGIRDELDLSSLPKEWQARQITIGDETEIVTGPMAEVGDHRELLEQFGYNPDDVVIEGTVNQWRKQKSDGTWLTSYFFKVKPRERTVDLPALYSAAKQRPKKPLTSPASENRVTVVALSDCQIGKVGALGGSAELVLRLEDKRRLLEDHLKKVRPESTVLAECGDLFEGFESGGNPMFTNDLSLAQQMDMAATELFEFISVMSRFGPVQVGAITSNHTSWRRGKQQLGNPSDDLALFVHKQVRKITEAAGMDVSWIIPAAFDESIVLDVLGTRLGMVHGNQFGKGGAINWWAKQQHGGQVCGSADILLTGHYHSFILQPTGRNPHTGRSKYWVQAPTLDNGSDWFRNVAGESSDPGLLLFDITDTGFDLQSLTVL